MSSKVLHVSSRTEVGTKSSRIARKKGLIPAVIYGHQKPKHVLVTSKEFFHEIKHISENEIVSLKNEDSEFQVLIKNYQADLLKNTIVHLDFFEIEKGKVLKIHIPLEFKGTPRGVREGGVIEVLLHEIHIECLPKNIPENMIVDISELQAHSSLHVSDIVAPPGVKFITPLDQVVASITHAKTASDTTVNENADGEES